MQSFNPISQAASHHDVCIAQTSPICGGKSRLLSQRRAVHVGRIILLRASSWTPCLALAGVQHGAKTYRILYMSNSVSKTMELLHNRACDRVAWRESPSLCVWVSNVPMRHHVGLSVYVFLMCLRGCAGVEVCLLGKSWLSTESIMD